jgi:prepilin-type N-terminal cleavage/methylation domain-containing protein
MKSWNMNRMSGFILKDPPEGFTLIELITAITIMAILSTIGIASFTNYSRTQALSNATQDVVTALQLAKASAASQVKPATCTPGVLVGYQVTIDATPGVESYSMAPVCDSVDVVAQKTTTLPQNIIFGANGTTSVLFHTVTGNVTITPASSTIVVQHQQVNKVGETLKKTITVEVDGRIHVQ